MTQSELITYLAESFLQLTHADAELPVKAILEALSNHLPRVTE
jgi:nucleoid DNA-binding protein